MNAIVFKPDCFKAVSIAVTYKKNKKHQSIDRLQFEKAKTILLFVVSVKCIHLYIHFQKAKHKMLFQAISFQKTLSCLENSAKYHSEQQAKENLQEDLQVLNFLFVAAGYWFYKKFSV